MSGNDRKPGESLLQTDNVLPGSRPRHFNLEARCRSVTLATKRSRLFTSTREEDQLARRTRPAIAPASGPGAPKRIGERKHDELGDSHAFDQQQRAISPEDPQRPFD